MQTLTLLAALALQLPGTAPLEPQRDFSAAMVEGIDRFLLRQTELAKEKRASYWNRDFTSPSAYEVSVQPNRMRLKEILGVVDPRLPISALDFVSDTQTSAVVLESATVTVSRVRWRVFEGVHGEGLLIQPKGAVLSRIICLPDADTPPEKMLDAMLVNAGAQIVIPMLISRDSSYSGSERLGISTNLPHREWIYRQSFILGRHVLGYELQKVLSLVDWFRNQPDQRPVCVAGFGEGGLLALYAGALDSRIDSIYVWGHFGPREGLWQEPIYRNVFGLLREFGDAELASLIAPRHLAIQYAGFPKIKGPPVAAPGQRNVAAPGFITMPSLSAVQEEMERARQLVPAFHDWARLYDAKSDNSDIVAHLFPDETATAMMTGMTSSSKDSLPSIPPGRMMAQREQVRELEVFTQRLLVTTEGERKNGFWKKLSLFSVPAFEKHIATERERFWSQVIGRFPDPDVPINPRSRMIKEVGEVVIHEVTLDVWSDVFAWGWLALPKSLKPCEKRPVIVCQHGLEGLPEHCFETDENSAAWKAYKAFALRLAEQGYIVFAPHNPYRGRDAFRSLQRKLNPLGKSLYSVINGQHQRILEWLKSQSFTRPDKIAFYGLSYGGKSAMRTPAVLTDYCLSICSGDFNEWVRKCATTDLALSYVFTGEYEIWEWNLGRTFNYAEMGALIAPRPFMVERGHKDGVGVDEWVNYEYAKIRQMYDQIGIGNRTVIEHFDGPHTIHGVGTFEFLHQWLGDPHR
ncbi:alpha/beta hydrolase family protein [Prosthecobacter dejongeii]|uniref:Dienelactone hydrolase n=1 Tax=Prosthecobacter dejongeii TaxID=48465 RepID=A0A7W8DRD5_9BACT|nr:alpha/beta hydrolase family protein [Prosthecobacter dejongeii]MBB5039170.1 dienelactone hydrolase [Prosthecobacter dejongeii]